MAFELEGLPDTIVHTQFALHSNDPLPVGARRSCIVDLSELFFTERPDIATRFALILDVTVDPVEGFLLRRLSHRARGNAFTPPPDEVLAPRYDECRFLHLEIENGSGSALSLNGTDGAIVTVVGIPLAPRPAGITTTPATPLPIQEDAPNETQARDFTGLVLSQNWFVVPS